MLEFDSVALLTAVIVLITNVVLLTWLIAKVRVQAEEIQHLRFQRRYDSRVITRLREQLADQEILGVARKAGVPEPRVGNVGKVLDYAETHSLNRT
jgi:hypothetical protein